MAPLETRPSGRVVKWREERGAPTLKWPPPLQNSHFRTAVQYWKRPLLNRYPMVPSSSETVVGDYSYHILFSDTRCSGDWYGLESRCVFRLDALSTYTRLMPVSVVRDKGRIRFIRCALVIVMYLIATSPLALRWKFVQGISDDKTQETTYIYSRGLILLSSMSFMAVILITGCIMVSRYHNYTYLSEGFDAGFGVDLVVLVFCWSEIDVCHHSRTMHHRRNEFSLLSYHQKFKLSSNVVLASVGLYQMTVTPSSGNGCVVQLDWMLPYFSMVLAVTLSCALVTLYHIIMDRCIGGRTLRVWIKVIVKSSLLFAAAPVAYIMSDTHTGCPLFVVTMIMVSFNSIFCLPGANISSSEFSAGPGYRSGPEQPLTARSEPWTPQVGHGGNAESASSEDREDSAVWFQEAATWTTSCSLCIIFHDRVSPTLPIWSNLDTNHVEDLHMSTAAAHTRGRHVDWRSRGYRGEPQRMTLEANCAISWVCIGTHIQLVIQSITSGRSPLKGIDCRHQRKLSETLAWNQ